MNFTREMYVRGVTGSFAGVAMKDFKGAGNPQFTFSEYEFCYTKSIMLYELFGLFVTEFTCAVYTQCLNKKKIAKVTYLEELAIVYHYPVRNPARISVTYRSRTQ